MSSFKCDKCNKPILDTPSGYITECEHYPVESKKRIFNKNIKGDKTMQKSNFKIELSLNDLKAILCNENGDLDVKVKNAIVQEFSKNLDEIFISRLPN